MSSVQIRMDGNGTTSVNEWMSGGARSPELGGAGTGRTADGEAMNRQTQTTVQRPMGK